VNGWARVRAWLRNRPDGQPFLRIHPRCAYLIRTLGALTMDEKTPEDLDTEGPDHAADALRYVIMARQAPPDAKVEMAYPPGTVGHMRQSLSHDMTRRVLGTGNVRLRKFAY
jgi:hypothetical protein